MKQVKYTNKELTICAKKKKYGNYTKILNKKGKNEYDCIFSKRGVQMPVGRMKQTRVRTPFSNRKICFYLHRDMGKDPACREMTPHDKAIGCFADFAHGIRVRFTGKKVVLYLK